MSKSKQRPKIATPKGWTKQARSALLHVLPYPVRCCLHSGLSAARLLVMLR